ncbi:MAG: hypothetical protein JOZ29_14020, partial [Deltaproteobacteria bacterium]|nr:hypothetical protein [Deltaproteobacteria bacterium]
MSEKALTFQQPEQRPVPRLLRAVALDKKFVDAGREIWVLRGLNLEVAAGEEIAIVGQ